MPRLDDPLTGTEHELERLRADEMLDGGLFTFRDGKRKGREEAISDRPTRTCIDNVGQTH